MNVLAFAPSAIFNSLGENAKSDFQIEYTGDLTLLCGVCGRHCPQHASPSGSYDREGWAGYDHTELTQLQPTPATVVGETDTQTDRTCQGLVISSVVRRAGFK